MELAEEEQEEEEDISKFIWLWSFLDLDKYSNIALLVLYRVTQACTMTWS